MSGAGTPSGVGRPVGAPETPGGERTLGQLVADASKDLSTIVRSEIALAKAELQRDVVAGALGAAMFLVAAVFAFLALILLLIAAAYGLVAAGLVAVAGLPHRRRGAAAHRARARLRRQVAAGQDQAAGADHPLHQGDRGRPEAGPLQRRLSGRPGCRAHVRRRRVVRPGRGAVGAPVRRRGRQPLPRRRAGRGPARPTPAWLPAVLVGLEAPARDPGRRRLPGRGDGPARLRRVGQDPARLRHDHLGGRRRERHPLAG